MRIRTTTRTKELDRSSHITVTEEQDENSAPRRPTQHHAVGLGLLMVLTVGACAGWLGYQTYQSHQAAAQRAQFLAVGRQAAINLTTIDWTHADADVQRILDLATGSFYNDFAQRSKPFIEVVNRARSTSVGTPAATGLESVGTDSARVLVAMSVKTTSADSREPLTRSWRMRIDVEKVADHVKVSDVEFVP